MSVTINGTNGLTFSDASVQNTAATGFGFKNRIINGAMMIDQRNAGASVTVNDNSQWIVDRWQVTDSSDAILSAQQSTDTPSGYTNSLKVTVSTADASIGATQFASIAQKIEGFNVFDLGFGASGASSVAVSFWVKSSVTGSYSCSIANNDSSRINPQSFTVNAANTWEQKTITFTGDTTGTWLKNNGIGMFLYVYMALGSTYLGSAGWNGSSIFGVTGQANALASVSNVFAITGVQLEKGSTATSFDYRPYGTELALCQRYYYRITPNTSANNSLLGVGYAGSAGTAFVHGTFPVTLRTTPTALEQSGTATDYAVGYLASAAVCNGVPTFSAATNTNQFRVIFNTANVLTAGQGCMGNSSNTVNGYLGWSAEL